MPSPENSNVDVGLGVIPDTFDGRDYIKVPHTGPLKERIDLSAHGRQEAWYQGRVGSCTGFASAALVRNLYGRLSPEGAWDPAPLWIYWHARKFYGTVDRDSGAPLRCVMRAMHKVGIAPLQVHPTLDDWRIEPSHTADAVAGLLKIRDYQRIIVGPGAPEAMMSCLCHESLPLLVAVNLFWHAQNGAAGSGELRMPVPGEGRVGGHAMMIDGYDMATQRFYGWNSWGKTWGKRGRFSIPFEAFTSFDTAIDIWTFSFRYW